MSKAVKPLAIIDPGHGGTDPGAIGFGKCERDWTLDVAQYVAARLNELDIPTVLTRTTDITLNSVARTNIVKRSGARYCLSLHYNTGGGEGVETIHSVYSSDAIAKAIAQEIHKEHAIPTCFQSSWQNWRLLLYAQDDWFC